MLKVLSIFGTRPEAIKIPLSFEPFVVAKMALVIRELAKYPVRIPSKACINHHTP